MRSIRIIFLCSLLPLLLVGCLESNTQLSKENSNGSRLAASEQEQRERKIIELQTLLKIIDNSAMDSSTKAALEARINAALVALNKSDLDSNTFSSVLIDIDKISTDVSAVTGGNAGDKVVDSGVTTLITTFGSASGSDSRYANSTSLYFVWSGASDSAGIKDYTVTVYSAGSCTGTSTTTSGVTNTYLAFTGSNGGAYSFKVTAYDKNGNGLVSSCSGSIIVDTTAPTALSSFSATTGSTPNAIDLSWTFPASTSDYSSMVIRRIAGATAPSDCSSGTAAKTYSTFSSTTYSDDTGTSGTSYSYRVCIYDAAGNVTSSNTATNVASCATAHTVFVTSATTSMSMGGLSGADTICTNAATAASLSGSYRAILSTTTMNARDRIVIRGTIKNTNNSTVATSKADFWDGTLTSAINYSAAGVLVNGVNVATSSDQAGVLNGTTCSDWTSTSGNNKYGTNSNTTSAWTNANTGACSTNFYLYCMSQVSYTALSGFSATAGSSSNGDVSVTITFPGSTSSYQQVDIRAMVGNVLPNSDCSSDGTVIKSYNTGTGFTSETFTHAGGISGEVWSYRACVYDTAGYLVDNDHTAGAVFSKGPKHFVFKTSTTYAGNFGGFAGGDAICAVRAAAAGLANSANYKVILSTSVATAPSRLTSVGAVYTVAGGKVATSISDMFDNSIMSSMSVNEFGTVVPHGYIWSGTTGLGAQTNTAQMCSDWTTNSSGGLGTVGEDMYVDGNYLYNYWQSCDNFFPIFCISQ